jgi:hypothetical protein
MTIEEHGRGNRLVRPRTWPGCSSARVLVTPLLAVLFRLHSSSTLVDVSPGGRMRRNCPSLTRRGAAGALQGRGAAPAATLPALMPAPEMFMRFLDLPSRTNQAFELALAGCGEADKLTLEGRGWKVREALALSSDVDAYRRYITRSRGEFTVAKDQNVRLRSGWFSDSSATYLAAGRPVITQETGFSNILPTGEAYSPSRKWRRPCRPSRA